jgi:hypothetical protein
MAVKKVLKGGGKKKAQAEPAAPPVAINDSPEASLLHNEATSSSGIEVCLFSVSEVHGETSFLPLRVLISDRFMMNHIRPFHGYAWVVT